jgi:4-diphosphocytidyl-2-C-methyl-D-erythritol kinase
MRETAPAKINLALHVTGRRADGYHDLDTLAVFADLGDEIAIEDTKARGTLVVDGPFASAIGGSVHDNLALRAAAAAAKAAGRDHDRLAIHLTKNIPVGAGLGGGSADAAAVLRLLGRAWKVTPPLEDVLAIGADVPMCLVSRPLRARGKGERTALLPSVPALPMVLVYPAMGVSTAEIFAARAGDFDPPLPDPPSFDSIAELVRWLRGTENGLEDAARFKAPAIASVLQALAAAPGAMMARMSGSGSTCFAIFPFWEAAEHAARVIRAAEPRWWVAATTCAGSDTPR